LFHAKTPRRREFVAGNCELKGKGQSWKLEGRLVLLFSITLLVAAVKDAAHKNINVILKWLLRSISHEVSVGYMH